MTETKVGMDEDQAKQKVDEASIRAAIEASVLPVYINRFELLPTQLSDHVTIAFGGASYAMTGPSEDEMIEVVAAKTHAAYMLSKDAALLLATKLNAFFPQKTEAVETEAEVEGLADAGGE